MRNCVAWWILLLGATETACNKDSKPESQGKAPQEDVAADETHGLPKELAVDLGGGVRMEFVLVPAGSFMMGDEKGEAWERPVHKVTITKPFYLGKFEVTQEQWQAAMGNNPSEFKGPKNPVDSASWGDCQAFLARLNEKSRSGGAKFSLPTEAQWEYACRAGTVTRFSFGDDSENLGDYAWWWKNAMSTHPVGQKKPNNWGLHDMHGNVKEWCADWFGDDYYANSPPDDPVNADSGGSRVSRGGSWLIDYPDDSPDYFRCAFRDGNGPDEHLHNQGFRVATALMP
jgi:formylglycine-generating enzyme required for sulfatase activity